MAKNKEEKGKIPAKMTIDKEPKKIKIMIDGEEFEAEHRVFKSGRKGYGLYGRVLIDKYPHRISCNIIEM